MRCPSCHHDNRSDRRFCTQCGAKLAMGCPSCGAPIEAGEKFCGGRGVALMMGGRPTTPSPAHAPLLPLVLAGLAEAHLALGELSEAVATAREGADLGSAGGCLYNEALAQLALAAALLATDGVVPRAEIESALERAEHLAASIEGSALSPRIRELRGRLAAAVGDASSSDRTLREALDLYRAIGANGHAERLARELEA